MLQSNPAALAAVPVLTASIPAAAAASAGASNELSYGCVDWFIYVDAGRPDIHHDMKSITPSGEQEWQ